MTVEAGPIYPSDLNEAYPLATDPRIEGDDHIRNNKLAMKNIAIGYTGALSVTAVDTGIADAYILTPSRPLPGYTLATQFVFKALNANTGACTVNVSGLGVKSIKTISGADPSAGDIFGEVTLRYDGTNMVIVSGSGFLSKTGAQTVSGDITFAIGPTVPTAAVGTTNSRAASHAFVAATAFSAALPAQIGNNGLFVTTNGTNASWASPFPSQVSNSGKVLSTNGTTTSWLPLLGIGAATPVAGNVALTNASSALQRISSSGFGFGATLPDATTMPTLGMPIFKFKNTGEYPMYLNDKGGTLRGWCYPTETTSVDLHDKSTSAGLWDAEDGHLLGILAQYVNSTLSLGSTAKVRAITMDSDRVMVLFGDTTLEGVIFTRSTGVFGAPFQIATGLGSGTWAGVLAATDKVLVVYDIGTPTTTSLSAVVVLTALGVGTVNTPVATSALAAALSVFGQAAVLFNGAVGFSYVRNSGASAQAAVIAISVTGTVPAFGADVAIGATANATAAPHLYVSGTSLVAIADDGTNYTGRSYTVSGNTLTGGTASTQAASGGATAFRTLALGARWVAIDSAVGGSSAALFSLAGTVMSSTTVATGFTATTTVLDAQAVSATKVVISGLNTTARFNVLTDNGSGTISAGTPLNITGSTAAPSFVNSSGTTAKFVASDGFMYSVDCSGASPVATQNRYLQSSAAVSTFTQTDAYMCQRNYTNLAAGSMNVALPTAGTQAALLGITANNHRVLAADFMPAGAVGCIGADSTESWVIAPLASGAQIQLVKAATP